jgi:tRNA dimethylallyltransferase
VHPNDTPKIIRAIEVSVLSRQPMSVMHRGSRDGLRGFRTFKIGLNPARAQLYQRINERIERMFAGGLLEETRALLAGSDNHRGDLKALGALGYRQVRAALQGKLRLEDAVRETQVATRRYAKRQMTWFRRETDVAWFAGFGDDPEIQGRVLEWVRQAVEARCPRISAERDASSTS